MNKLLSNTLLNKEIDNIKASGQCHHAYLLIGDAGSGKKTAARLLAYAAIDKSPPANQNAAHPDIKYIAPQAGKRSISVEAIRAQRADSMLPPSVSPRKVYIIDSAQTLSEDCQNALLTILEQPPRYAVFILLSTARGALLPTVRSRCREYAMQPVPALKIEQFLSALKLFEPAKIKAAALASGGNIGLAQSILKDQSFHQGLKYSLTVFRLIAAKKRYELLKLITLMDKDALKNFLRIFVLFSRDIIVAKEANAAKTLLFEKTVLKNAQLFDKIEIGRLFEYVNAAKSAASMLDRYINPGLVSARFAAQLI